MEQASSYQEDLDHGTVVYEDASGTEARIEHVMQVEQEGSILLVHHRDELADDWKYADGVPESTTRIPLQRVVRIDDN